MNVSIHGQVGERVLRETLQKMQASLMIRICVLFIPQQILLIIHH